MKHKVTLLNLGLIIGLRGSTPCETYYEHIMNIEASVLEASVLEI